jgi:predicted Rossmann fold flavoprotein
MVYDIAIIGAGASGLMLASKLKDKKVCIIDKMPKIGSKIKVSGGAKCNITNKYLNASKYLGDEEFINVVLNIFGNKELIKFLNANGINLTLNEKIVKGTYFCKNSQYVIDMFKKLTSKHKFYLNSMVKDVEYKNNKFVVETIDKKIETKKLIIASGGLSYPVLGATGIGYKIALKFGHNIIKPNPALVGFTIQKEQFWFKTLSGLSIDEVTITIGDKKVRGGMLFTHKGFSGPAVLSASLYWKKGLISIDFTPNKNSYLPKRFKQTIKNMSINLRDYKIAPAGNFGYTKAEATSGGVCTSQIDATSMHSNLQKNLYFTGEVLDVTGELGGYNFQWAFSCAMVLYKNLNKKVR